MKVSECTECGHRGIGWPHLNKEGLRCNECGGLMKTYEVTDPPELPQYRVIAVANTVFRGHDIDDIKRNFMKRAETLEEDEWTFIWVEPLQSSISKVKEE